MSNSPILLMGFLMNIFFPKSYLGGPSWLMLSAHLVCDPAQPTRKNQS